MDADGQAQHAHDPSVGTRRPADETPWWPKARRLRELLADLGRIEEVQLHLALALCDFDKQRDAARADGRDEDVTWCNAGIAGALDGRAGLRQAANDIRAAHDALDHLPDAGPDPEEQP